MELKKRKRVITENPLRLYLKITKDFFQKNRSRAHIIKEENTKCRNLNTDGAVPKKKKTIINRRKTMMGQHKITEKKDNNARIT
jgi:hypothetical protein